jgi:hypothetical protein
MADERLAEQTTMAPTNKVVAATNMAGTIAGIVTGTMAAYGGPAILELLDKAWAASHPNAAQLIVLLITGVAGGLATKFGGKAAAFNVLDKVNRPIGDQP